LGDCRSTRRSTTATTWFIYRGKGQRSVQSVHIPFQNAVDRSTHAHQAHTDLLGELRHVRAADGLHLFLFHIVYVCMHVDRLSEHAYSHTNTTTTTAVHQSKGTQTPDTPAYIYTDLLGAQPLTREELEGKGTANQLPHLQILEPCRYHVGMGVGGRWSVSHWCVWASCVLTCVIVLLY
jgi:hypothetical protein